MSEEDDECGIKEPPRKLGGILKELGPGLIVAAAVVGSGELIATTATGAPGRILPFMADYHRMYYQSVCPSRNWSLCYNYR